ncbi:MAG: hypothetical protein R3F54_28550 [Alphaproteobacteria bacterium]
MDSYGIKNIGEQRYREDPGRSYEGFVVGDIDEHWPGRTVTETDNVWFTNLTMNTHPAHFVDAKSELGRCLVNSTLPLALVAGMTVRETSQRTAARRSHAIKSTFAGPAA